MTRRYIDVLNDEERALVSYQEQLRAEIRQLESKKRFLEREVMGLNATKSEFTYTSSPVVSTTATLGPDTKTWYNEAETFVAESLEEVNEVLSKQRPGGAISLWIKPRQRPEPNHRVDWSTDYLRWKTYRYTGRGE